MCNFMSTNLILKSEIYVLTEMEEVVGNYSHPAHSKLHSCLDLETILAHNTKDNCQLI